MSIFFMHDPYRSTLIHAALLKSSRESLCGLARVDLPNDYTNDDTGQVNCKFCISHMEVMWRRTLTSPEANGLTFYYYVTTGDIHYLTEARVVMAETGAVMLAGRAQGTNVDDHRLYVPIDDFIDQLIIGNGWIYQRPPDQADQSHVLKVQTKGDTDEH